MAGYLLDTNVISETRKTRADPRVDGIETTFADRVLSVDMSVARVWGELSAGRNLPVIDTLIAATAIVNGLTLVTRNTRDVELTGVLMIDPWQGG